jgi:hypothetical protein
MDNITLAKIIDVICAIASGERNINTVIQNDIYELDGQPDTKYNVFGITQNIHSEDDQFMYYDFNLYFINRITNDERSNEILNQSTGIQVLRNIIRKTCEYLDIEVNTDIQYFPFIQKFADVCSGVYADVIFAVPIDLCVEDYGESDDILDRQ